MAVMTLANSIVTKQDLTNCIRLFKDIQLSEEKKVLQVVAQKEVIDIDILLIGYLILFKDLLPQLNISLILPHNTATGESDGLDYKLKQYGIYAQLMTGQHVFSLRYGNQEIDFDFRKDFRLSKRFMLLLLVSERQMNVYKAVFEESLSAEQLKIGLNEVGWHKTSENLYADLNSALRKRANPSERIEAIKELGRIAFYKSLNNAKVLSFYLDPHYRENPSYRNQELQAGSLSSRQEVDKRIYDAYDFFHNVKPVFDELSQLPLIYHIVFATLTSSELLPGALTEATKSTFQQTLFNLWGFTQDLVHGINELAKNILEHASPAPGIITTRLVRQRRYKAFRDLDTPEVSFLKDFLDHLPTNKQEPEALLELHIADLGIDGILPKLRESTVDMFKDLPTGDVLFSSLEEDLKLFENGIIRLNHLLDVSKQALLNQQSKRSIAHFGLLTFSKLIDTNDGAILLSSVGHSQPDTAIVSKGLTGSYPRVEFGTHFYVMLPVNAKRSVKPHLHHPIRLPAETSAVDIRGMEGLLAYQQLWLNDKNNSNAKISEQSIFLLNYKTELFIIRDRDNELVFWNNFSKSLQKFLKTNSQGKPYLVVMDLSNVELDGTQLFRILGRWENNFPKINLLVTNLQTEKFLELLKITRFFYYRNPKIGFWNAYSATLIYHFLQHENGRRFYFTDALWGSNEQDFMKLNRVISHNHFNAVNTITQIEDTTTGSVNLSTHNELIFFQQNILLPFDVLLYGPDKLTLFEHNALFLLQNKMTSENPQE